MKILFFVEVFLPKAQTFIFNQIKWFIHQADVKIVCIERTEDDYAQIFDITEIPLRDNPILKLSRRIRFNKYNPKFKKNLNAFIVKYNPDIIQCHFGTQAITLVDNISNNLIPVCITLHGYDITKSIKNSILYKRKLKRVFEQPNIHPIFVCEFHREHLSQLHIKSDNAIVLYNGIYPDFFKRDTYPENENKVFIQVSRFVEKKGHKYTVLAFSEFYKQNPNSNVIVKFIGDGPLRRDIIDLIKTLNLETKIEVLKWLEPDEIKKEYEKANYYIQHSIVSDDGDQEATSVTILEAMAMELPILSTMHSGIPEVVSQNENGILVEERNIPQLTKAIANIQKFSFLDTNRQKVISQFNLEKRNLQLFQHYKEICQLIT